MKSLEAYDEIMEDQIWEGIVERVTEGEKKSRYSKEWKNILLTK